MQRCQALLKILDCGSFRQAASELGYSQSAVSKMITSLETEFSVPLIRRSRYGISLTPEGEELLPYIRRTVTQYELMHTAVEDLQGLVTGIIRIGTFSSISSLWLAPMISSFWKDYPGIRFELLQGDYSDISDMVRSGRLDIGFVNREASAGLHTTHLKTDEFLLVLPVNHPLAAKESPSLSDIREERFLMVRTGERQSFSELAKAFRHAGITPNIVFEADNDHTILSLVEQGAGVSILSEKIIRQSGRNVAARSLDVPIRRDICLITRSDRTVPVACRRFIRFFTEHIDKLP